MKIEGIIFHPVLLGGVATNKEDTNLFEAAQTALLYAKKNLPATFVTYKEAVGIKEAFTYNMEWSIKINEAFFNQTLEPYFQAIYDIKNKKIMKFEALIRMRDNGAIIDPCFFLNAAKSIGKLHDISLFMIASVLKVASRYKDIAFSINITFKDFDDQYFINYITQQSNFYNVDPQKITFELLETDTLENPEMVIGAINQLKSKGFKIAIDNFGSGHSNFAHLMRMRVDYIKIDGQFIKDIVKNPHSVSITRKHQVNPILTLKRY